jgi:hypothetical protein
MPSYVLVSFGTFLERVWGHGGGVGLALVMDCRVHLHQSKGNHHTYSLISLATTSSSQPPSTTTFLTTTSTSTATTFSTILTPSFFGQQSAIFSVAPSITVAPVP